MSPLIYFAAMSEQAPNFLDQDGNASVATLVMMSHHGFRRDLTLFARALDRPMDAAALQAEWKLFHDHLHGHHQAEDQGIFPHLRAEQPALVAVIDGLTADHRRIDPLLEEGDHAFAQLPEGASRAAAVIAQLSALLHAHLATEEARVLPCLRDAREFPAPATEAELDLFAEGFAWALHGIAPEVVASAHRLLPTALTARLPAARAPRPGPRRRPRGRRL
jgi:hemerythrin-like domain-containing protein